MAEYDFSKPLLPMRGNFIQLDEFIKYQQSVSKSVISDKQKQKRQAVRKQRKSKGHFISELRPPDRANISRFDETSRNGCHNRSRQAQTSSKNKRDVSLNRTNHCISNNQTRSVKENGEIILQAIIQKQRILKDLDRRIEMKMSEWLLFEAEANKKMAAYTNELSKIEEDTRLQRQQLQAIKQKVAQSQQTYNARSADLNKRKQQLQDLCRYVEQTTKDQDLLKTQLEAEKSALKAKFLQVEAIRKDLDLRERQIIEAEARVRNYEQEILDAMSQLQKREEQMMEKHSQMTKQKQKVEEKEIEVQQKEKVISQYVSQLNNCIHNLTNERSSLLSINTNLERRCCQLENLELKLFRKVNEENELDRYLVDSTNLDIKTPIKGNKENIFTRKPISMTEKKQPRRDDRVILQELSSDLLEDCRDSGASFDF